jgi:hypothetical protein
MINPDKIPRDLDSAINLLVNDLKEEDREFIKNNESISLHHGLGRSIRNAWNLWDKETHLVQWFIKNLGICHADDISGIIFTGVWQKVLNQYFDPLKEVERYHRHWKACGYDPATMEKLT